MCLVCLVCVSACARVCTCGDFGFYLARSRISPAYVHKARVRRGGVCVRSRVECEYLVHRFQRFETLFFLVDEVLLFLDEHFLVIGVGVVGVLGAIGIFSV